MRLLAFVAGATRGQLNESSDAAREEFLDQREEGSGDTAGFRRVDWHDQLRGHLVVIV